MRNKWIIVPIFLLLSGCSSQAQFGKTKLGKALEKIQTQTGPLSENDIANGLKEALKGRNRQRIFGGFPDRWVP